MKESKYFNIEYASHESDWKDLTIIRLLGEVADLEDKIDKAIEYIENEFDEVGCCISGSDLPYSYIEELLDILKGSDSNGYNKE